jgi:hypothetical protein
MILREMENPWPWLYYASLLYYVSFTKEAGNKIPPDYYHAQIYKLMAVYTRHI